MSDRLDILAALMRQRPGDAELVLSFAAEAWRVDALCREQVGGSFTWFPTRGEDHRPAVLCCQLCSVSRSCLEYALSIDDYDLAGIWGGFTQEQRRRMRRGPRRETALRVRK
jgi:hypothetical protein